MSVSGITGLFLRQGRQDCELRHIIFLYAKLNMSLYICGECIFQENDRHISRTGISWRDWKGPSGWAVFTLLCFETWRCVSCSPSFTSAVALQTWLTREETGWRDKQGGRCCSCPHPYTSCWCGDLFCSLPGHRWRQGQAAPVVMRIRTEGQHLWDL